jgi:DNA mismatch endonuclease (patch repair protein)
MTDVVPPAVRSRMMGSIRSRDTKPELQVRRYLHASGFRFRLARKDLPGKPDLVLPRWRVAIFVHGCFWHGHSGCRYATLPKTRPEFWASKIAGNSARDVRSVDALLALGWRVAVVWECALRDAHDSTLAILEKTIRSGVQQADIRGPTQPFKKECTTDAICRAIHGGTAFPT